MKKVVIIGGGTAGWLTALFFQKYKKDYQITIIESTKVGILGAGESSTPNLEGLLSNIEIDITDFINKTGATIKTSNHFVNWSPNKDDYYHNFKLEYDITKIEKKSFGFHFDAKRCASYFKEIGLNRGLIHIDGFISNFTKKENGDISHIHLDNGDIVECDYMVDCSGFARIGMGKLYNSEWKSYSEYLPANSAFAYFLPQEKNIGTNTATQTQSIAMNAGWMWQAPLQHRWGCGYVYNDKYITLEEAIKEVEEFIGQKIEVVKTFKFEAGSYKDTWINNCVSLGLASGFLEPLEGTSLMTLLWSITKILELGGFEVETGRERYNAFVRDINYQSMLFVKHHYNCSRTDTQFWRDVQLSKSPIELENIMKIGLAKLDNDRNLMDVINPNTELGIFGLENYTTVYYGQRKKIKKTII